MSVFINNGLSGLLASQRALQTISNNVANVNTEGYVRQSATLAANPTQYQGGFGVGTGVRVDSIERVYDQFLGDEVKNATMAQSRAESYNEMAMKLDGLLGNPDLNISVSMQSFFDQLEAVNRDPTSRVNREQMLASGETLANRFSQISSQIDGLGNEIDNRLQMSVNAVNDLAASLADVNAKIASAGQGTPNDLLDQQERLLTELAGYIDFNTVRREPGTVDVMVGSGQPLVLGQDSQKLALIPNEFDSSKMELAYANGGVLQPISSRVSGGSIAGMLGFRNEALAGVNRELGQMALGLTETFNAQHTQGLDLTGRGGEAFFNTLTPLASASANNSGSASVALSFGDVSQVEAKDYEMLFTGSAWQLTDASTGSSIPISGNGTASNPFIVDGMEVVVSGSADAGDSFLLQPVTQVAASFALAITDPEKIAVSGSLAVNPSVNNVGTAAVSSFSGSPSGTSTIVFDDANTYHIENFLGADQSGPLAYTSGEDISFDSWTVNLNGTPQAGDEFRVNTTGAGSGDNSNGIQLASIAKQGFFANGSLSVEGISASMLTSIGSAAARSGQDLIVQSSLLEQAEMDLQSVSGVNLEEEAANLLKYQEAYLAASKIIGVANDLFQTLLATVR